MKILAHVKDKTMANGSTVFFDSGETVEKREEEKITSEGRRSEANVIDNDSNWEEEETASTNSSLKSEFRKLFLQFLTQLAWGCLINLRVGFLF